MLGSSSVETPRQSEINLAEKCHPYRRTRQEFHTTHASRPAFVLFVQMQGFAYTILVVLARTPSSSDTTSS